MTDAAVGSGRAVRMNHLSPNRAGGLKPDFNGLLGLGIGPHMSDGGQPTFLVNEEYSIGSFRIETGQTHQPFFTLFRESYSMSPIHIGANPPA